MCNGDWSPSATPASKGVQLSYDWSASRLTCKKELKVTSASVCAHWQYVRDTSLRSGQENQELVTQLGCRRGHDFVGI
jgi:hypothetical protein